jgi:muramoyltetrapeptide carboxypeptidase
VGAKPYQIDRMLWQLRAGGQAGGRARHRLRRDARLRLARRAAELLDEVILRALEDFDGPIAIGLRSGHVSRQNVTLTFGVEAELRDREDEAQLQPA